LGFSVSFKSAGSIAGHPRFSWARKLPQNSNAAAANVMKTSRLSWTTPRPLVGIDSLRKGIFAPAAMQATRCVSLYSPALVAICRLARSTYAGAG
jgi:hypothetical protein